MHIVFTPSGEYFAHIASKGPMQWTAPVPSHYKTSKWVVRICSIPDYVYIFESSYTITFVFFQYMVRIFTGYVVFVNGIQKINMIKKS